MLKTEQRLTALLAPEWVAVRQRTPSTSTHIFCLTHQKTRARMFAVHVASASSGTGTFPKDAVDRIGDVIDAAAWAGVEPGVILAKNLTNGPAQLWDAATARCMAIEAIRRRLQKAAAEGKPVEADLTWWNLEYPPDAADQPAAATIEKGTHE